MSCVVLAKVTSQCHFSISLLSGTDTGNQSTRKADTEHFTVLPDEESWRPKHLLTCRHTNLTNAEHNNANLSTDAAGMRCYLFPASKQLRSIFPLVSPMVPWARDLSIFSNLLLNNGTKSKKLMLSIYGICRCIFFIAFPDRTRRPPGWWWLAPSRSARRSTTAMIFLAGGNMPGPCLWVPGT